MYLVYEEVKGTCVASGRGIISRLSFILQRFMLQPPRSYQLYQIANILHSLHLGSYPVGIGCSLNCHGWWARLGLNQRPLACEASALPLSYAPMQLKAGVSETPGVLSSELFSELDFPGCWVSCKLQKIKIVGDHMPFDIGVMLRGQYAFDVDMVAMAEDLIEQARMADRLGYASITKGSHYSTPDYQALQQLPLLARLTGEVKNARLNAGVVLLPLHKPLDVAEQFATMDVISNGRMILGVGIGYRDVELKAFGTAMKERGKRANESLIAIKRLWTEDVVSMKGSHFYLDEAVCWPKPIQKPYPPIWIGANADVALKRAVEHGDCWYINPHTTITTLDRQVEIYRRMLDEADKPFPKEFPMRREAFVAPTRDEAVRLAGPFVSKKYASYHGTGQSDQLPEGETLAGGFEELVGDRFLIGSPDDVVEQMIDINKRLGVNHLILSMEWAGMDKAVAMDCMQLMAEEVIPQVKSAV